MRVLIFDIETAPILAHVWGLRDQNIALNQIERDSYVMAWGAKWLGSPVKEVMYADGRKASPGDDKAILKPLWSLLDQADIVVTQNGQSFDSPRLNARFIQHGMLPPKPYKHIDTYRIARSSMSFTSNKLEYLADKLCTKYKKLKHDKFPGFSLWSECLKGNKKAWDEMKKYNIHDVLSTEELYLQLRKWAPANMIKAFAGSNPEIVCLTCGETGKMAKRGWCLTRHYKTQRFQCKCGAWQSGPKVKHD